MNSTNFPAAQLVEIMAITTIMPYYLVGSRGEIRRQYAANINDDISRLQLGK
jgi:hypothetical protein